MSAIVSPVHARESATPDVEKPTSQAHVLDPGELVLYPGQLVQEEAAALL